MLFRSLRIWPELIRTNHQFSLEMGIIPNEAFDELAHGIRRRRHAKKVLARSRIILVEPTSQTRFRLGIATFQRFKNGDRRGRGWPRVGPRSVGSPRMQRKTPAFDPLPSKEEKAQRRGARQHVQQEHEADNPSRFRGEIQSANEPAFSSKPKSITTSTRHFGRNPLGDNLSEFAMLQKCATLKQNSPAILAHAGLWKGHFTESNERDRKSTRLNSSHSSVSRMPSSA